jgi:(2Fe-2S) ferredoxin
MELVDAFKSAYAEAGSPAKIRIQRAGCLDFCGKGPAMVVYPEGVFYGNVSLDDVKEITQKHLIEGEVVSRLQIG